MILPMLFVMFVGLKLTGAIEWSWIAVSIPLIIMVIRWVMREIFINAIKSRDPWAIRLALWMKS